MFFLNVFFCGKHPCLGRGEECDADGLGCAQDAKQEQEDRNRSSSCQTDEEIEKKAADLQSNAEDLPTYYRLCPKPFNSACDIVVRTLNRKP